MFIIETTAFDLPYPEAEEKECITERHTRRYAHQAFNLFHTFCKSKHYLTVSVINRTRKHGEKLLQHWEGP